MFLELKNAEYLGDYKVKVLFNTNEEKIVDFKNYVQHEERKILQPLKNEDFFKTLFVHSEFGTLSWKDEIDIAPEFVYELAS
jgi:hypothetical protein